MWLFDDLIKKPTPQSSSSGQDPQSQGSTQQWSGQQDPLQNVTATQAAPVEVIIEKSEEWSIMTEKPVIQNPELPASPKPSESTADDGSLLIVGENGETPIIPSDSTNESGIPVLEPIVDMSSTPEQDDKPSLTNSPGTQSLREIQLNRMKPETDTTVSEQDEDMLNNLFGTPSESAPVAVVEDTVEELPIVATEGELFEDPVSFVEASIEKIEIMIAHIEETHDAKLKEAAGYKSEKEKFANLEANAYKDGERMMKEKAHAERMKAYFIDQRNAKYDTPTESKGKHPSIETTLTSLSVKNSVDEATSDHESKKSHKKAEKNVIDI